MLSKSLVGDNTNKGGVKSVDYTDNEATKFDFTPGITFGYAVQIPVTKWFALQPALNFVQKGGKSTETDSGYGDFKTNLVLNYFELPVNFTYHSAKGFFAGAGPAIAAGVGGKAKTKSSYTNGGVSNDVTAVSFGDNKDDEFRLLEFSGNIVAGYYFVNGLTLSLNYNKGFSNLLQGSVANDGKITTSYFALKIGYSFYATKKR